MVGVHGFLLGEDNPAVFFLRQLYDLDVILRKHERKQDLPDIVQDPNRVDHIGAFGAGPHGNQLGGFRDTDRMEPESRSVDIIGDFRTEQVSDGG